MTDTQKIEFQCAVARVQNMADNGVRVWLDLPEDNAMTMALLHECKRFGVVLKATLEPEENGEELPVFEP